jgi:hypothetical protein
LQALLVALILVAGMAGPANAQSAADADFVDVRVFMKSGFSAYGRHAVADDFVVVCPATEVLDPSHPCSESNAKVQFNAVDDLVLACPVKEVLDPGHACFGRRAQIIRATPDDFVLVCPVKEVLDPTHPCSETNASVVQFEIPGDYVMTCPAKEVLEPGHPCASRSH